MKKSYSVLIWSVSLVVILAIICCSLLTGKTKTISSQSVVTSETSNQTSTEKTYTEETIKIGNVGDILIHSPIFRSVAQNDGSYDFNPIFKYVKEYYESYDIMVADLEQPLAGKEKGYSGFPLFNAPDSIATALKQNGVDVVLTANNHCYDQSESGFYRTMDVLEQNNLDYIGSRKETSKPYIIKSAKGINVGMINYTYETQRLTDTKYINGIPMSQSTKDLLNTFNYDDLEAFYKDIETNISNMYKDGADVIIAYMHWGTEYSLTANSYQTQMAQKLCDLGVDVIVGGHTHCIEPTDLITSEISGKQTPIIYSTGNQLSNQRKETLSSFPASTPYFEDGVIYEIEFSRKKDGSVVLSNISYTPTWCNLFGSSYYIIPLENIDAYASLGRSFEMQNSKKRTDGLLQKGVQKYKDEYKQKDLRK